MQESIDRAACDLRVESSLGRASGDDELKIRKLRLEALCQLRDRAHRCGGVDYNDTRAVADEMCRKIRFGADDEELTFRAAGRAHGRTERRVVREHDETFAHGRTQTAREFLRHVCLAQTYCAIQRNF